MAVVKADAYGHGLLLAAEAFLAGGADVLGVHSLAEARPCGTAGSTAPILVLGPVDRPRSDPWPADWTSRSRWPRWRPCERPRPAGVPALRIHLKVETGVNRQGLVESELDAALELLDGRPRL